MSVKVTVDVLKSRDIKPVGCRICGGELVQAPTLISSGTMSLALKCAVYSSATSRYLGYDGSTIYVSTNGYYYTSLTSATGRGFTLQDVDSGNKRAVMVCGTRCLAHTGNGFSSYGNPVSLYCGALHCGRLFAIETGNKYVLRWTKSGVKDWTESIKGAGKLTMDPARGEGIDIVSYGGELVVVRRYGLTVLKMYGSPENFGVAITDTDSDQIYESTAKVVLGKLYFYTASGIRVYDGSVIKKVSHRFENDISAVTCAEGFAGKYYLSCTFKDGTKHVICYDAEDGESYLIDIGITCFLTNYYGLCGYDSTTYYKLAIGGNYSFSAGRIDFGTDGEKTVLSMRIDSDGVDVTISNGVQTKTYSNVSGVIRPRMKGRYFTVAVSGNNKVRAVTATAEVADAV